MKKKGKMYKIRKREGENVYDVRRKVKGKIKKERWKEGRKEGHYLPLRWKFFVNM